MILLCLKIDVYTVGQFVHIFKNMILPYQNFQVSTNVCCKLSSSLMNFDDQASMDENLQGIKQQ